MTKHAMTNEEIAELMAEKLFDSAENKIEFAFQLFVERFVLSPEERGYTKASMKASIIKSLKKQDRIQKIKTLKIDEKPKHRRSTKV